MRKNLIIKLTSMRKSILLLVTFMFLLWVTAAFGQSNAVTGTVTDVNGEPLIGVNIMVKGTKTGITTDIDGKYSLQPVTNQSILVFSYIGFITQELTLGNQRRLNVQLKEDTQRLEEVIVVGYGTQKKSEITASVSSLSEENFNATIASSSALELAMGRIPGLLITNANGTDPRQTTQIQIRGTSTMRGVTTPLIVIDGVPGGNLDLIPPEDITNISVLKDASAAAIYGTRGANGVILVTTKKGRVSGEIKSTIDYSTTMSHSYIYKRPRMLTGEEYRNYMQSGGYNAGMLHDYGDNTDWQDLLTNKNNFAHTHNLSLRGGTLNNNYRASVYYRTFDPIGIESDQTNWGTRLSVNHLGLNDRLDVQLNLNADFRERNELGTNDMWEQAAQRNPTEPSKDENGNWLEDAAYNSENPLARYATWEDKSSRASWMLSSRATLTVIEGLKVSLMTSWQQSNTTQNQYRLRTSKWSKDNVEGGGRAQKWSSKNVQQVMELTIDYNKIFNDVHLVNVIAGHSYEYGVSESFNAWNTGFVTDTYKYNDLGGGTGITRGNTSYVNMGSSKRDNKLAAFFGRVNYAYNDKYLFSATLRMDGSSRFGANYRWGKFPAVSAGWVINKEEFMKGIDFVNFLKLRVGYGITGNLPSDGDGELGISGNYAYMATFGVTNRYPINGVWNPSYGPNRNPNPNLKWEEKREFNIGLDFTIFKNRINGTIDVYNRNTVDLINNYNAQVPPMILTSITTNVGKMNNKGLEIGINAQIINNRTFRYDVNYTFTQQKNTLVSLSNDWYKSTFQEWQGLPSPGALGNAYRSAEGQSTGLFYGKRFAGFTPEGKWLFYNRNNEVVPLSEMKPEDLTTIGNGNPKFQMSLNNNLRYKQFDLSLFFRGKFGFDILNTKEMYFGNANWFPNNVLLSAITTHAELKDAPQYSDYYIERVNYVKLASMTLGYNFNIKNKTWVRNLRVYASWQDVFTLTNYTGTTPELRDTGFTPGYDARGFFPVTSSLMFGLNAGF